MPHGKKKNKKRTGLGTGASCMGLNIRKQEDCPFHAKAYDYSYCTVSEECLGDCDLDNCKLKEFRRIIVDWKG